MSKVNSSKLLKEYIQLAGALPNLCETKEELFDMLDALVMQAKERGMSDYDAERLTIVFNFFKSIVIKRNKFKGGE